MKCNIWIVRLSSGEEKKENMREEGTLWSKFYTTMKFYISLHEDIYTVHASVHDRSLNIATREL